MRLPAALGSIVLALCMGIGASQAPPTVAIDDDDIGGVVTSSKGPEAGVWVIAETTDLPTKFARIVVTDDRGRYLIPDLPKATYDVWVRGYGLVDSRARHRRAGQAARISRPCRARPARGGAVLSGGLLVLADAGARRRASFPGTGANGIAPGMKTQADWLRTMKSGTCLACHALGTKATREIPVALDAMSPTDAWQRRINSGQAGGDMMRGMTSLGMGRALTMFADWTTRIAKGEVPPAPPRPQGIERNDRHHRVGLGRSEGVSARRGVDRPPQSAAQRERPDLRLARAQHRLPAGARSGAQHGQPRAVDRARSGDADDVAGDGRSRR